MVARAVVGVPTVLCLWISEIIAALPGRCAVTLLELLTGTMLTGSGAISQAILAVPCRRDWASYYWMVRKGQVDWEGVGQGLCRLVGGGVPAGGWGVGGGGNPVPRGAAGGAGGPRPCG